MMFIFSVPFSECCWLNRAKNVPSVSCTFFTRKPVFCLTLGLPSDPVAELPLNLFAVSWNVCLDQRISSEK